MFSWLFRRNKAQLPNDFRRLLDPDAVEIVQRLQRAGHETYLVGGCVRDIILEKKPKDFDIATKATPQQVKSLVTRAFIIGRRFRIVVAKRRDYHAERKARDRHIPEGQLFPVFHDRVREKEYQITTFRRDPVEVEGKINENVFGTAQDDAARRDFTVNALFLDPVSGKIVDHVGGLNDLKQKRLRVIGSPHERFHEDPIRILRALRFVAKAHLKFDPSTEKALVNKVPELAQSKKERIREEVLKIFKEPGAGHVFAEMNRHQIWKTFSPRFGARLKTQAGAEKTLEKIGRAANAQPWANNTQSAPLFYLLFYDFLKEGASLTDPAFLEILDDFKVSRVEREEMVRIRGTLHRLERDPLAEHPTRLLTRNPRHYGTTAPSFFVLKVLAEAGLEPYARLWPKWEGPWKEFLHFMAHEAISHRPPPSGGRSSGSGGGGGRSRRRGPHPSRSSSPTASPAPRRSGGGRSPRPAVSSDTSSPTSSASTVSSTRVASSVPVSSAGGSSGSSDSSSGDLT